MREEVCTFGGSYDNNVLWYNDDKNSFFIDQYHFGVIDDEEHFDGTVQIDTLTALEKMIENNKLRAVLMYSVSHRISLQDSYQQVQLCLLWVITRHS